MTTRNTRADVVEAAGRLFAERGYHGTSMRDLGRELGLLGSSVYAHVDSKESLLVAVVEKGSHLFRASAKAALEGSENPERRLLNLIAGHIDVVLANPDVVRTFLNEARMLDDAYRTLVIAARDGYEATFRSVLAAGAANGAFNSRRDPKTSAIFVLSILNSVERWYDPSGEIDPAGLKSEVQSFVLTGLA